MGINSLYYIEWAYQRSRLCHKCDVTTGSICKPGYKCDVNLQLHPYILAGSLNGCGLRLIMIFIIRHQHLCILRFGSYPFLMKTTKHVVANVLEAFELRISEHSDSLSATFVLTDLPL